MNISGVYKIQSILKPERVYIGSAVNINRRWNMHRSKLRRNIHHSIKLQSHYNKYGESDLQFSVILECPKEQLLTREQDFIDALNPWFNICKIADSPLGITRSKEFKENLKGNKNASGNKGQIPWHKGKTGVYSKETLKKNSDFHKGLPSPMKGKHHSKESCLKMSKFRDGKKRGPYKIKLKID